MPRIDTFRGELAYWRSLPLAELERMLRAERERGVEGHWAYDLPRHRTMLEVYRTKKAEAEHATEPR